MIAPLIAAIEAHMGANPPERMAVAVSGGGDSVALLAALVPYCRDKDVELHVITVDHGLREEARDEIALVTDLCIRWNLPHHVEYWVGWDGQGNLQAAARDARYELIANWACANRIGHIAVGHTADDQAETFVMRLARGSGVDGLSAMAPRRIRHGITWVRPFLEIERMTLRDVLRDAGINWCDDPSNLSHDFERVRVREALAVLNPLGVTTGKLVEVADHMARARDALDWQTFLAAREMADVVHGVISIDLAKFRLLPQEIARRLMLHTLSWTSHSTYPPRKDAVARTISAVRGGGTATLDGCHICVENGMIWVFRELNAVKDIVSEVGDMWDDRWVIAGPEDDPDFEVRPLGYEALANIEGWRNFGLPRAALAASPAVWYEGRLVAAPFVGLDDEWSAELDGGKDAFFAALLSH
ncbi:tRNA(Ile)-lysidine synthase [Tateyamaria omphalii]|uniref:tRNA lysidine(34) synthetase TilS n=1 Tax=Tateyamaria omphalii TaxID=299262 RepID=UPI0016766718|nr:tRNA lysidine(34) synthetase TilS [Tateyamaria omphalii]GGX49330.1 tRNA(Ile)-lysidine synthase [Tateyamaria omphalii]